LQSDHNENDREKNYCNKIEQEESYHKEIDNDESKFSSQNFKNYLGTLEKYKIRARNQELSDEELPKEEFITLASKEIEPKLNAISKKIDFFESDKCSSPSDTVFLINLGRILNQKNVDKELQNVLESPEHTLKQIEIMADEKNSSKNMGKDLNTQKLYNISQIERN
jgi:hypothetical protein